MYLSENLSRKEFVTKVVKAFKNELKGVKKIFVKPNIVSHEEYPTTTHPEVLETLLNCLNGCEILVGDAPAFDAGLSNKIIQNSSLMTVCKNHGIKLMNLYNEEMKTIVSSRGYHITVSSVPLRCNYVISLPVLKSHGTVGLSGALKNQFGYLSKRDRLLMHSKIKSIDKGIAEVNVAVPSNLFIVDGIDTMVKAQECRHGGCPADLNVLMAGTDPVSLDILGLKLLERVESRHLEKKNRALKYIEIAAKYGLGSQKFSAHTSF